MSAMHLEVINSEGDWQTACGAWTQRTTGKLEEVTCRRCRRSGPWRAESGEDVKIRTRTTHARSKP